MQNTRRNPVITAHAKQRLKERIGTFQGYRSWDELVKCARYNGKREREFSENELEWFNRAIRGLRKSSQVRILNGFAFLFSGNKGHARTLVTVMKVEDS